MRHISDFHRDLIAKYFKINCDKKQCACLCLPLAIKLEVKLTWRSFTGRDEKRKESIKAQLQYGLSAIKTHFNMASLAFFD